MSRVAGQQTTSSEVLKWLAGLDPRAVDVWREFTAHTRSLHGDIWNGVRFFQTLNAIAIAGIIAVGTSSAGTLSSRNTVFFIAALGILNSILGLWTLYGHRRYYQAAQVRKALLERELGFYDIDLGGVDAVLPWGPDRSALDALAVDPARWQHEHIRSGVITPWLFGAYIGMIVAYVIAAIVIL